MDFPVRDRNRTTSAAETQNKRGDSCPNCGTKIFRIERTIFGKKKTPLTVAGESLRGVCLKCNHPNTATSLPPITPPSSSRPTSVPQVLEVQTRADRGNNDDMTVVSQITLDHRLEMMEDESDEESTDFRVVPGQRRPEPSLGDPDDFVHRRSRELTTQHRNSAVEPRSVGLMADSQLDQQRRRAAYTRLGSGHATLYEDTVYETNNNNANARPTAAVARPDLIRDSSAAWMDQVGADAFESGGGASSVASPTTLPHQQSTSRLMMRALTSSSETSVHDPRTDFRRNVSGGWEQPPALLQPPSARIHQEEKAEIPDPEPPSLRLTTSDAGSLIALSFGQKHKATRRGNTDEQYQQQQKRNNNNNGTAFTDGSAMVRQSNSGSSSRESSREPTPANRSTNGRLNHQQCARGKTPEQVMEEIPEFLDQINADNSYDGGGDYILYAIQALASIVWVAGNPAKLAIALGQGIEGLIQSMWASMGDADVQEAAVNLLFALAASNDGQADSDVLVGSAADDAVDALLIVMQTHLTVENIQHSACGALACLAAASGTNPNINDGSLSGSLVSVINAMEAHRNSKSVQERGIRALYNQCVFSKNAESNKRSLLKAGNDGGRGGSEVIYHALEISAADVVTNEWACRLYWGISASGEDAAAFLSETPDPLPLLLQALQRFHQEPSAASLISAIFGCLANFVKYRNKKRNVMLDDISFLVLVLEAAKLHKGNEDVHLEAFALIANIVSSTPETAAAAVEAETIKVIVDALQAFPTNMALYEEAVRALLCLSIASEDAKGYLCTPAVLSCLSEASETHFQSVVGQETFCYLLSSLVVRKGFQHTVISNGGVEMLISAMKAHPHEKRVQEAACLAIRNLACHDNEDAQLDFTQPVHFVSRAMAAHHHSESIQLNGCCTLWNVAFMRNMRDKDVIDVEMVEDIVKAIQNHLESAEVLEMACGVLWSQIDGSKVRIKAAVDSGGLEAVTCVLVMHPDESATLERACGFLSNVSASEVFADQLENSHCIGNVVEAMRANSSSELLLEFGSLVLRNMVLIRPERVSEACSVVTTVLNGMKEHIDAVGFQREACSLLWAMTALSEDCKAKVLSLDGMTVLLGCLEHNSSFSDVQDAALGAFNQLSSNMVA